LPDLRPASSPDGGAGGGGGGDPLSDASEAVGPADAAPGDLASALVGRWPFEEKSGTTTADVSGMANPCMLMGGATFEMGGFPGAMFTNDRNLRLDGTDGRLAVAKDLGPTLGGTVSLSYWFETTQVGNDLIPQAPGLAGSTDATSGIVWGYIDSKGNMGVRPAGGLPALTGKAINDFKWHHIVLTRDAGTGKLEVYLDGALASSVMSAAGARVAKPVLLLGRLVDSAKPYFRGHIDDLRIYNRVITPAEVMTIYLGN
jgi:hypothetical protein